MENLSLPEWTLSFRLSGRPYFFDGKADHRQIVVEFLFKLGDVADVVHALVEPAGELGRDGLDRYVLVGKRGQNDQQLHRRLRGVGFVHGNFRDERAFALGLDDVAVDAAGFPHGEEIFVRDLLHVGTARFQTACDAGDYHLSDEFGMAVHERLDVSGGRRFANGVSHINREEIRMGNKPVHRFEPDVVGIHVPGFVPAEFLAAASAAAVTLDGSEPTIRCSRLDLFQTGVMFTPFSAASIKARNCASACCAKRSPTPMEYFSSVNIESSPVLI